MSIDPQFIMIGRTSIFLMEPGWIILPYLDDIFGVYLELLYSIMKD